MVADGGPGVVNPGGDDKKTCGLQKFDLERKPAELMLVLDRSGSMADKPRGGLTTKWADATAALNETIMQTAGTISWGLKMPSSTDVTCAINNSIEVPSALDNFTPVTTTYLTAGPNGDGTPTTQAIRKAVAYLQGKPSINKRYLVLTTDGEPTCMDGINHGIPPTLPPCKRWPTQRRPAFTLSSWASPPTRAPPPC